MYAIFEKGGKQYRITSGDRIAIERMSLDPGTEITIDSVLMVNQDGESSWGSPHVSGVKIVATVESNGRSKKVLVHKQRPRKVYRKTNGHRQGYTTLKIKEIILGG